MNASPSRDGGFADLDRDALARHEDAVAGDGGPRRDHAREHGEPEPRFRAGILDIVTLHGLGKPDQEDRLLPEPRRRAPIDDDNAGDRFR